MSESHPLRSVRLGTKGRRMEVRFSEASIHLDTPGPYNLKSWFVEIHGLDADCANWLDDVYYEGDGRVDLVMKTGGGKEWRGEAEIRTIVVGPRSRVKLTGIGVLTGFSTRV